MRGANGIQAILDHRSREFRFIAVATEMPEVHVLKVRRNQFRQDIGCRFVAEMPVAAHDPLLDAPRAAEIVLQQFHVVVCFLDQNIGSANPFHHQFRGVPQVGEETNAATIRVQHKTDGIISVMRNRERFDSDVAEFECGTRVEETKIEAGIFELQFDCFLGEAIAVNGNGQFVAECAEAVGVVGMFVRKKNAAETFGRATDLGETFADLFGAETGIDQEPGAAGLEVGAIAIGTAAENRELNRD
jgi:hypothetical protein